jgi:5'-nucleotidase/UDP-sugar diphosphatase
MKKAVEPFNASILLSYTVIEYIRSHKGAVQPATDGRLTVVGGITP